MQDGEREEANRVESGSELQVDFVQDVKDPEKPDSVKVEYRGIDDNLVDNGTNPMVKSDGLNDGLKVEVDLGNVGPAEICCDGDTGELKPSNGDEISSGVLISNNCPKFDSLGCSIQEGLEKVSLGNAPVGSVVTASDMKEREIAQASNEDENDDSSESETETSSSSSSSSSSESDDEEEEEEKKEKEQSCKIMIDKTEQRVDLEEGEIMGSDVEKMVSWSDNDDEDGDNYVEPREGFEVGDIDDDDDVTVGPIKSKNELVVLPPVPPVNVTLEPCHQVSPVGVVLSVLGSQVIIEGSEKHNPLSEGSILWITEKRSPLGLVDEIFGPVKTPYYIVRYNSESEVPSGIQTGTPVGFVPQFVDHVLNDKSLYKKGYDASGENDEELSDEMEFSDDEQEAEYKRMMKMSKRGNNNNNNQGPGNKRKNRRNLKNRENTWTKDQPSALGAQTVQSSQSNQNQSALAQTVQSSLSNKNQSGFAQTMQPSQTNQNQSGFAQTVQSSQSNQNQPGFPSNPPILPLGPNGPGAFPQQGQMPSGFMINGMWVNRMPFQQQNMNMAFPTGFQMNGMPWFQQQQNPQISLQMPSMNPTPWQQVQQPFDLSQLVSGSSASSPLALVNFANGQGNSAWPGGILGPNLSPNQAQQMFPGSSPQLPMFQGMQQPNGPQGGQNGNSQSGASFPGNVGARPQFNQGSTGRGRNPYHHRGGGGRFGGGRGRQQSK